MCSCPNGMVGNAFVQCTALQGTIRRTSYMTYIWFYSNISVVYHISITIDTVKENPCSPSPCGPNSICREINGQPVCSCVAGFLGAPPTCRPECIVSTDCPLSEACSNQKCVNPCPGSCGFRALCNVVNHNPICNCPSDLTGDPFVQCIPRRKIDFLSFGFF